MRFTWLLLALSACASGAEAAEPTTRVDSAFWDHWGDGRAELAGYSLKFPRYGEIRTGRTVLVFVTETFTEGQRVKSDGGHPDEYPVLKLNRSDEFQTGIYDYNVMTSAFLRLDGAPLGVPTKVSMSMQEWCGHVYEQLVPTDRSLAWTSHSYFDGEADRSTAFDIPTGGVLLDALPILVRGLAGDLLEPGGEATFPAFPTLVSGRIAHRAPSWGEVTVRRSAKTSEVTVPAGTFEVHTVTTTAGKTTTTWSVEAAYPHRLIRWASDAGEVAELLDSTRLPYWQRNREGDEALLGELGLSAPQ